MTSDLKDGAVSLNELPISFNVKYLGCKPARGLWGIKQTRGPVDTLVELAKNLPPGSNLPHVRLTITTKGIVLKDISKPPKNDKFYAISTISYGVQDLVYTRVFSMIVVHEDIGEIRNQNPFECHAFVCESRIVARRLTYALAAAFQEYSRVIQESSSEMSDSTSRRKYAIDLRTPEELQNDIEAETEA